MFFENYTMKLLAALFVTLATLVLILTALVSTLNGSIASRRLLTLTTLVLVLIGITALVLVLVGVATLILVRITGIRIATWIRHVEV
jgi:hypothetical protein